jgi:cupin 2 domain-containing protein
MRAPENLLADLPARLPAEQVRTLLRAAGVRVERIVSHGHASPDGFWYDQDWPEWVVVLAGAARLRFEDEPRPVEMTAGSFVDIPAHRRHRVEWTDPARPTVWLAIHYRADPPVAATDDPTIASGRTGPPLGGG